MQYGGTSFDMPKHASEDSSSGMGSEMFKTQAEKQWKKHAKAEIVVRHVDIIKDEFWKGRPWLLSE